MFTNIIKSHIPFPFQTSKYSVAPIDDEKLLSAAKSEKAKKEVFDALKSFVDKVEEDKLEVRLNTNSK